MGKKRLHRGLAMTKGKKPTGQLPQSGSSASREKTSGLGKKVVEIVVELLKSALSTWVLEKVRRGAQRR